ncbi:ferritin [uncultured Porphyromonas sp.]|uniref:ferritin n=1 Tax=uncultured Porphyromonas sp. TaxID=159274 RepID=UPI00260D6EA3|nr:ferritin [uncultured Porphyromonas sp.]
MKINDQMAALVNAQVNEEFHAAHLYLAMSFQMANEGYDGFAHWFLQQYHEEIEHALEMAQYLQARSGQPHLTGVAEMPQHFGTPLELFEAAYKHECHVTEQIHKIYKHALDTSDYATSSFFKKYIDEQVEEEDSVLAIIDHLRMAGDKGIYLVNAQLGKR